MPNDEAGLQNEVSNGSGNEAGSTGESGSHALINQWTVVLAIVTVGTLVSTLLCSALHGEKLNSLYIFMMIFLWFNAVCGVLEIACLYIGRDHLKQEFARVRGGYHGQGLKLLLAAFNEPVNRQNLFSIKDWSKLFVAWGVLDRDYATQNSFGYLGEVGNGVFTIIPTCAVLLGLTFPVFPATVVGIIGVAFWYQTIWGTLVYVLGLWKFADNSENSLMGNIVLIGGNFPWLILPMLGVYTSVRLILDNSFQVFFN